MKKYRCVLVKRSYVFVDIEGEDAETAGAEALAQYKAQNPDVREVEFDYANEIKDTPC